ncbi:hypothetical protein BH23BAC1_BH23BAC1_38280 [soil metagenome]
MNKKETLKVLLSLIILFFFVLILISCASSIENISPLKAKIIALDAGHGGTSQTDFYRVGPAGEREEWINLRVALMLRDLLENRGAKVIMTRIDDSDMGLEDRARLAIEHKADVFISIHHNATADREVNFPIIYFHGNASENTASVLLARQVGRQLSNHLFAGDNLISIVSDHCIFPSGGTSVLRNTYGIPGIIGEASFFTNPDEEQRLKDENYNRQEAQAYLEALELYFKGKIPAIKEKYKEVQVPPFKVFQEAERMRPEARLWLEDYQNGKEFYEKDALDTAYNLLTRSARSFPDSYVAGDVHLLRAKILERLDSMEAANATYLRVKEFYLKKY